MATDDDGNRSESRRQIARRERRTAGERSAVAARKLMEMSGADLARLNLEDDLRQATDQARAVTSPGARRRAERYLAGQLRQADVEDLEARLATVKEAGNASAGQFHLAETWRARLIEGGATAEEFCASAPGVDAAALATTIDEARRERDTGKPRGAARALFRVLMAALREAETGR